MPKMHWGSVIGDMFVAEKMIVLTFLDFPNPDKSHRSSAIDDFFISFVNVYPSVFFGAEGDRLSLETLCE
jgi:hypothetical protein